MEENKEMTTPQPNTGDPVPAPGFSGSDVVFAWLSLLLGFMFCQCFPVMEYPFGGFLFMAVLYIATAVILLVQKVRIPLPCWLSALSAIVISGALVLTDNGFLVFCANAYGLVTYCHFVFAAFGNGVDTDKFERIYAMLLDEIYAACPDVKIMLIAPFVLEGSASCNTEEIPDRLERFRRDVAEKAEVTERIAARYGLPCIQLQPAFDAACKKAAPAHWAADGVHPTPAGHELIKRLWLETFETME